MKRKLKPGLPGLFDRFNDKQRNIIERMFEWLEENRRIVTRFDKLAKTTCHDLTGLLHAMFATSLFVQNLELPVPVQRISHDDIPRAQGSLSLRTPVWLAIHYKPQPVSHSF